MQLWAPEPLDLDVAFFVADLPAADPDRWEAWGWSANTPEPALFVDPDALAADLIQSTERFRRAVDVDAALRARVERRSIHYFYPTR